MRKRVKLELGKNLRFLAPGEKEASLEGVQEEVEIRHSTTTSSKERVFFFFAKAGKNTWNTIGILNLYKTEKTYTVWVGNLELSPVEAEEYRGVLFTFLKKGKSKIKIRIDVILAQSEKEVISKAKKKIKELCKDVEIRVEEWKGEEKMMDFKWEGALKELKDKVSSGDLQHISKKIKL